MKDERKIEAVKQFIEACNNMLLAQNHLAVITKVDFSGLYCAAYDAKEVTTSWLEKLETK